MKKVLILISFILLAAASFVGGIFIAEKRIQIKKAEILTKTVTIDNAPAEAEQAPAQIVEPASENLPAEQPSQEAVAPEPPAPPSFSFAVLGDTQYFKPNTNGGFQKAVRAIQKQNVSLAVIDGDLVSSCDKGSDCVNKLNQWKSVIGPLASKTYAVQGNHDIIGEESADKAWRSVFTFPTNGPSGFSELVYSFDFENSHFVMLDSNNPKAHLINGEQRAWLDQDLTRNKKENTFVFFHEPAYPVSHKISESLDANASERDALWNILTKHKVTAVFNGHEHIHSRRKVNGLYQFVFGNTDSFDHQMPKAGVAEYAYKGQTFGIVQVEGKKITVKVYSVNGNELNSFTFSK